MKSAFIFLYGPPASGKSVIGERLAKLLERPFYDLDHEIEAAAGMHIPDIFYEEGEEGFRQREREGLISIIQKKPGVVALGGGALLNATNRALAESSGVSICLSAGFETILLRLESGGGNRPLLEGDSKKKLKDLLTARNYHYASFPQQVVTDGLSIEEAVWEIQRKLGIFPIHGMGKAYDVILNSDNVDSLNNLMEERGLRGPAVLVTDENVASYHADAVLKELSKLGSNPELIVVPAGEVHKTFMTVQHILDRFVDAGLDRSSTVIALGGGVVGDLAGFAAAIYLRGISWVGVPTSLLAMVDASLGGKTGVDLAKGKNLAGAFYPPSLVMVNPNFISTLPEVEIRNGLAEVIKHGIIADPALFALCRAGWSEVMVNIEEVIRRAIAVKAKIIEQDPYEQDRRASLNLGHTLGHGIEKATNFQIRHGEAVSIGMVAASRLAEEKGIAAAGLAQEVEDCLTAVGLPTGMPSDIDFEQLKEAMMVDKKRKAGRLRAVLPVQLGEVHWGVELDGPEELIGVMR